MRHSGTSRPFRIVKTGWPIACAALLAADVTPAVFAIGGVASQAPQAAGKFLSEPLITDIYTADPSAHVFNGRLFIYPSHDIDAGVKPDDLGSHFAMRDYHVLSMDRIGGKVTDHGVALDIKDVPWAGRQMWAPDAAEKGGRYYLYFPVKDKEDAFRIGVAVGRAPQGPFKAQPAPIKGTFSIDPCVFKDSDGQHYMYFGGIWGGQLQRWATGSYVANDVYPAKDQPAISAKVARLGDDMLALAESPRDVVLLDESGKPLVAADNGRRFFEGSWLHKYNGTYYFGTRPATRTSSCTPRGSRRMAPLPSAARSSSRCSAGPITTRSSSSRASGTSSTMTRSCRRGRRTCATSRSPS